MILIRRIQNRFHNKFKYVFKIIIGVKLKLVHWNEYRSILL
jgi:hypothetical protein